MPCVVFETKSTTPETGLATRPARPIPTPPKKPPNPDYLAPSIGLVTIPVTPLKIEFPNPIIP
jgi:hypothetical protein